MRICYITQAGFDSPTAERTHALEVIRAIVGRGHAVTVWHPGRTSIVDEVGASERRAPVSGDRLKKVCFQFWLLYIFLLRRNRLKDIDVIYVRQAALMLVPIIVRKWIGVPVISEFNTFFAKPETASGSDVLLSILHRIESAVLRRSDRVVVVSNSLKAEILKRYAVDAEKVLVVQNGVNTVLMSPRRKSASKRKLGISEASFVIGFVGTLHVWQGIEPLLKAVQQLKKVIHDVKLVIAGTSDNIADYMAIADSLGLDDTVIFLGAVEHECVPDVVGAFDIAVAPGDPNGSTSYYIRSPLKVYEYLSCGRPVVAGRLDTLNILFAQQEVGFVISPGSTEEMVTVFRRMFHDPSLSERMGANARRVALASLSWGGVADQLIRLANEASAAK